MNSKIYILWILCVITQTVNAQPIDNVYFSTVRGLFDSSLFVYLQTDELGATISYTLDGSEPNASNGITYTLPIFMETTTLVRAIAYTSTDTSEIVTHSYIFPDEVLDAATNQELTESLLDIPTISIVTNSVINSDDPVRASVEFLYPDKAKNHQINVGIRYTNGGQANIYQKKTMRLYFKSQYGPKKLEYDLFSETPYSDFTSNEFDKINIRYGSQDNIVNSNWWQIGPTVFLRNRWGYDTQSAMGWNAPHGNYMHVYVNGEYSGMYHVHEIPDESFQEAYRGGGKEEYDVIKNGVVAEGTNVAWYAAQTKLADNDFVGFAEDVDIENYMDYHLLSWYQGNTDWPQNNWCMARKRTAGEKFQFFPWDLDRTLLNATDDPQLTFSAGFNISIVMQNPDFEIIMRDRIYKHFFRDGALTTQKTLERFQYRVTEMRKGVIAETARWGDSQADWLNNVDWYLNDYFPNRSSFVLNELIEEEYYPNFDPPVYSQFGGAVFPGFQLTLLNPNNQGTVYYTTDGTDPRASGGGVSASAQQYTAPFVLPGNVVEVCARVLLNSEWSAACPVLFYFPQDYSPLVINEIHYHPADSLLENDGENHEFIEIKNTGTDTIYLSDVKFTAGVRFRFDKNAYITPDGFLVIARDSTAFFEKYGFNPDGDYAGKLSNDGEYIKLSDPFDNLIDSVLYNDVMTWDTLADGYGYSLELINPNFDNALSVSWLHSQNECGTPRAENTLQCSISTFEVLINEINYKYTEEFLALNANDWVELYNNSPLSYDLSGWSIVDSDSTYVIPTGTIIAAGEYLVFAKDTTLFKAAHPDVNVVGPTGLGFGSTGDMIALLDQSGCPIDGLNYGVGGAWPSTSAGQGPTLSLLLPTLDNAEGMNWSASGNYGGTPGSLNSFSTCNIANSVIINEINYKSPISPFADDWVELHNATANDIDISGWEFHDNNNFYTVPDEITIPAGGFHVLVRNALTFQNVFPSVTDYSGNLGLGMNSNGEIVGLFDEHRCLIDVVDYDSTPPWVTEPNKTGPTLSLISPTYNNDLAGSWVPSTQGNAPNGTPAAPNNIDDPCTAGLAEIIINEINYNPNTFDNSGDWLELYNMSSFIGNISGWKLHYQNNAYTIPQGTIIAPNGFLLLVKDVALFSSRFPAISNFISVPALELNDDKDRLFLYSAASCLIDSVGYADSSPWPTGADGFGASLSVINPISDNANPVNWMALQGVRTPGSSNEIVCAPGEPFINLKLWLMAGTGVKFLSSPASDGNPVTEWKDQSVMGNDASQSFFIDAPTFYENIINGHPGARFDGVDDWMKINNLAGVLSGETTFFAVIAPKADTDNGYYLSTNFAGDNRIKFGHRPIGELMYDDDVASLSSDNYLNKKTIISCNITPDIRAEGYINSTKAVPWTTNMNSSGADRASLGQEFDGNGGDNETSNHWKGDLAELIIYNKILTEDERHVVESYLAIKYGITIPVGNHLFFRHDNYPNNIAGIGMSLTQCLLQRGSMNVETGAIVAMETTNGLNQGNYLVWGHDGTPTITTTAQVPSTTIERLERIWRITETGDVGKVNVSFVTTGLGLDISNLNDFAILIDSDDGDFSNARTHFQGAEISGDTITFNGVEFEDDDWFTLAVKQQACPTNGIVVPATVCYLTPIPFFPNINVPNTTYKWSFQQGNPALFIDSDASTYWNITGTFTVELVIEYQHCADTIQQNVNVEICSAPPDATFDFYQIDEDDVLLGNVLNNDSDPYGNNLIVDIMPLNDVSNGSLILNANGDFSYIPNPEFSGTDNFTYQICNDGQPTFCTTADVTINVVYINDAPIIGIDSIAITNDSVATGNLLTNDSDIEGDLLTQTTTPIVFPQNGDVILQNDGTYFYFPNASFIGLDSFTYRVCDDGTPQACSEGMVHINIIPTCLHIELYLWLEGAYDNGANMRTDLNTLRKILPGQSASTQTGQPYTAAPWNYSGTEGAAFTDADYRPDIVDWVLVSFRTGTTKATEIKATAALLLEDGTVQFVEDCVLTTSASSPLYILVEHRNHIGIMSPNMVAISGRALVHDFRVADSYRDPTSFGQKQTDANTWMMYAADGSQTSDIISYDINGTDKSEWTIDNGIFGQYLPTDFNMDGDITGEDKILWQANNGISSRVSK